MFQRIDVDTQIIHNAINDKLKLFNDSNATNTFLSLISNDFISISGSTILQIIQNNLYNSDIDIYIEINNLTIAKYNIIIDLIKFLYNNNFTHWYRSLDLLLDEVEQVFNNQMNNNIDFSIGTYSTLKQYIKYFVRFTNINSTIELIFIKTDIETLITNTFDYDIVKNYWKNNYIYSFNSISITNKIATMTLNHFIRRILCGANREFTNFINRFAKYTKRGFTIFINKTKITPPIFNHIIQMYYYNSKINNYYNDVKQIILYNNNNIMIDRLFVTKRIMYFYKGDFIEVFTAMPIYILKYILIAGLIQKCNISIKLSKYSNYLLDYYVNPNSNALFTRINDWHIGDTGNTNKLYYLNSNNTVKKFTFKHS